jgi:polysaccharide export outer membrane protein
MPRNFTGLKYLLFFFFIASIASSCVNSKKIAYFNDVKDSARIASKVGLEAVIQKKDILSISVSSLSNGATAIFNAPNQSSASGSSGSSGSQTAGYLVSEDGTIKFPILGSIPAAGRTQKELEDQITY